MTKLSHFIKYPTTLLLLVYCTASFAGSLSSTVNRNQINANETLALTVTYDQQIDSSKLTLGALDKDFEVLNVSPQSSSAVSIVNGKATRQASTVWSIILAPKRLGQLTIPSFSIGQDASQAILVEVAKGATSGSSNEPLRVTVLTNHKEVYPSQQLLIEVELVAQRNIGDLNGPQLIIKDAEVEAIDQQNFQRVDNGVALNVVILKYAVFAKEGKDLVIPIMTFTGIKDGRRSLFGNRGQQVVARTKQLTIPVKNIPETDSRPWFPAEKVSLSVEWSDNIAELRVGEPITRTVTIAAFAQRASTIPPLATKPSDSNFKSYKDQPQLNNDATKSGFISTRIESEAIVPSKAGTITLPALKVEWWDVNKKSWQQVSLPAETLTVTGTASNALNLDRLEHNKLAQSSLEPSIATITNAAEPSQTIKIIMALLATLCLLQGWIIFRLKRRAKPVKGDDLLIVNQRQAWTNLQKSLATEDLNEIRKELVQWGKTVGTKTGIASIQGLMEQSNDPDVIAALLGLESKLYKGNVDFSISQLAEVLPKLKRELERQSLSSSSSQADLPALYPQS